MKNNIIYKYVMLLVMVMSSVMGWAQYKDAHIWMDKGTSIALGYKPNKYTRLVIKVRVPKKDGIYLLGSDKGGEQSFYVTRSDKGFAARFNKSTVSVTADMDSISKVPCYISLSKDGLAVDYGKLKGRHDVFASFSGDFDDFLEGNPIVLNNINTSAGLALSSDGSNSDVYEVWIYDDDKLVHHYFPSDQKNGLYDVITKQHITSTLSGVWVYKDNCIHQYTHTTGAGENMSFVCELCGSTKASVKDAHLSANEILLVDPMLDFNAKKAGIQAVSINCPNKMTSFCVLDSATNELLVSGDFFDEPAASATVSLDPYDADRTLALYANTSRISYGETPADTVYGWYKAYVHYKPLHKLTQMEVIELQNIDEETGIRNPANLIRFAIDNVPVMMSEDGELIPREKAELDVISDDNFVVERSFTEDFDLAEVVGYLGFDKIESLETVEVDGKTVMRGWFSLIDKNTDALCNALDSSRNSVFIGNEDVLKNDLLTANEKTILKEYFTYPERHVYYRVSRTMPCQLWTECSDYQKDAKSSAGCLLPGVTTVSVEQNRNWSSNKKVKVKVRLDNPFPWEFNPLLNTGTVKSVFEAFSTKTNDKFGRRYIWDENARILVQRYSPDSIHAKGVDYASKTLVINGKDVKWDNEAGAYMAEVEDVQNLPYMYYYYSAIVDSASTAFPVAYNELKSTTKEEALACYSENSQLISDLKVSRGDNRGSVLLEWQKGDYNLSKLTIKRREYGKENDKWKELLETSDQITIYEDTSACIGKVYEYKVEGGLSIDYRMVNGAPMFCSNVLGDWGYAPYYGKLAGSVRMSNGISMAGIKVRISRNVPIHIDDVFDRYGNLLMAGVHEGIDAQAAPRKAEDKTEPVIDLDGRFKFERIVYTDEQGKWEADNLLMSSDGSNYIVEVMEYKGTFEYMGKQDFPTVKLSKSQYENTDVNLVYVSTKRVSGYAYYRNSTIPVPNANFYLDGVMLYNSNGEPIRTQPDGKFTITVSSQQPINSLEIRKAGHKFTDNGVMIDSTTVTKDLDGFIMYDDTKVRLAGRIVGGDREGNKPLGFGLSKNNLGDDIKLVLQLEGDNSASIVYFPNDPNRDKVEETFDHNIYNIGIVGKDPDLTYKIDSTIVGKTTMTSERKRIVIDVDNNTGEYMVDLYPAKYKVVQMYAKGYSTLYRANEGLAVIDLSDVEPGFRNEDIHLETIRDKNWVSAYDATFNRTFHNPVNITYRQYEKGKAVDYFGDKETQVQNVFELNPTKSQIVSHVKVGTEEAPRDSVVYAFGCPVFSSGSRYLLQTLTYEDYIYNNEIGNAIDIVPVGGDTLIVRNNIGSNNTELVAVNNEKGMALVTIEAGNPTFFDEGDVALRSVNFMVKSNGYYYEGPQLSGVVMGERTLGTEVLAIGDNITALDVLRDPPGSKSYAYREKGTQYVWDYSYNSVSGDNFNGSFDAGVTFILGAGLGAYVGSEVDVTALSGSFVQPLFRDTQADKAQYVMTLNDRISTSDDPLDQGAMSDVYIGTVSTYGMSQRQVIEVFDEETYKRSYPLIQQGIASVIREGVGADGKRCYLVVHDRYNFGPCSMSSFAYSQKYIVGTLIPGLKQKLEELLTVANTQEDVDKLKAMEKLMYWRSLSDPDVIEWNCTKKNEVNIAQSLVNTIKQWEGLIRANESEKVNAKGRSVASRYSVADSKVEKVVEGSNYGMHMEWHTGYGTLQWSLSGGVSEKPTNSHADKAFSWNKTQEEIRAQKQLFDEQAAIDNLMNIDIDAAFAGNDVAVPANDPVAGHVHARANSRQRRQGSFLKGYGVKLGFSIGGSRTSSASGDRSAYTMFSGGYGYVLDTNDNGNMTVAVYEDTASVDYAATSVVNSINTSIIDEYKTEITEKQKVHNFIFRTEGGAARNPWMPVDTTLYFTPIGTPLGEPMLKIDNPKIYVDKPVVNNITKDEKAVFSIRLTNESEIAQADAALLHPSTFYLKVSDKSNPYGAKVYMDGQPISTSRSFCIAPGESVTKTIEVERGTNEYNYDDLELTFNDEMFTLCSSAKISVHYLPTSTPLRLSVPTDKWVMNTYSQMDEEGKFYIPVEITDYSLTYDNFDHIDLQYKKATEGESQWVTLCSYYADADLYKKASGAKAMIESGSKINNIKFFGGVNVEEQEYNLRAVSYCRMGNDFVTRASDVISGIKDTRRPEIFGVPTPTNGILSYNDVIQFPFTERIAYNHLNATSNFTVQGYTNEMMGTFSNPLHFNGKPGSYAESEVERSLARRDFTIDMLVKMDKSTKIAPLFSVGNEVNSLALTAISNPGNNPSTRLIFYAGQNIIGSEKIPGDLQSGLTRVGVIVNDAAKSVKFIYDKNIYDADPEYMKVNGDYKDPTTGETIHVSTLDYVSFKGTDVYGHVYLGCDAATADSLSFNGEMSEVRLWNKALTTEDVGRTYNRRLTGYERFLIGYWPLNEAVGDQALDKVNGATLNLKGTAWQNDAGVSLLTGNEVRLKSDAIAAAMGEDFTMRFWFRTRPSSATEDKACLFRAGNEELKKGNGRMYIGFENGKLVLNSMDESLVLGDMKDYANDKWHNFTLVVSRMKNSFATYLDGQLKLQGEADMIDQPDNGYMSLGDPALDTNYDEFAVWAKALPLHYIQQFYNTRIFGTEDDLLIYLPFERQTLDSHNLPVRVFSPYNQKLSERIVRYPDGKEEKTGEMVADGTLLIMDNSEQGYGEENGYANLTDETYCAPLKTTPELSNLDFSWSSTGTALQINLNKDDAAINKQYVYVTVRDVEDEQGNTIRSPHMWSYFVDKNVLRWNKQNVTIKVPYGEGVTEKVAWRNICGRRMSYTIENTASWLSLTNNFQQTSSATTIQGVAMAEEENEVTLHIGDGISPGFYSETIYLTDENGLSEPLNVNLIVEAVKPEWAMVDPTEFEYTMNMKAVVKVEGRDGKLVIDNDARDMVAAYYGRKCVGVANITTKNDNAYVYMTIYGDTVMNNHEAKVSFRLWSASTGKMSELRLYAYDESAQKYSDKVDIMTFKNGKFVGVAPSMPYELRVCDYMEQQIDLKPGWNWVSFNVIPSKTHSADSLFIHYNGFTEGDIFKRIDYSTFHQDVDKWVGRLDNLDYKFTYQVFAKNGGRLGIRGKDPLKVFDAVETVKIVGEGKWSDLPYHLKVVQPIQVALSDFQIGDKASVGDIIKGHDSFAVATENGWEGSLDYMRPGEGYYICHSGKEVTFLYPENMDMATQTTVNTQKRRNARINPDALTETAMPIIAVIDEEVGFAEGDILQAYCNGELISEAEAMEIGTEGEKRFFLTVNAGEGNVIEFVVLRADGEHKAVTKVKYNSSVVIGSLDNPCVIRFTEKDGIDSLIDADIYDVSGRKLMKGNLMRNGIYIINNEKVMVK